MRSIISIVEGHSETEAVPVILRRLIDQRRIHSEIEAARPFRTHKGSLLRPGGLEKAIRQAIRDRPDPGCVMVIIDADDDLPCELGPELFKRCDRLNLPLPVSVVIANRELEAWFLGAKQSLRGIRGIRAEANSPKNPESIRGAKERLSDNMDGRRYLEVVDQPALAAKFDLGPAEKNCPSFERFLREFDRLLAAMGIPANSAET